MDYLVFIDESGSFGKNSDQSVVGAGIMSITYKTLRNNFKEMQRKVNEACQYNFDVNKDIHLAPLLHSAANSGSEEQRVRFSRISIKERKKFAEACKTTVLDSFDQYVFSKNQGFEFESPDAQDRYFHNLIATINSSLNYIKLKGKVGLTNIFIAPRSTKCIAGHINWDTYHTSLIKYLENIFSDPKLRISFDRNHRKGLGLDSADVICYYRDNVEFKAKSIFTKPNARSVSQKQQAQSSVLNELLEKKEYVTAYRWVKTTDEKDMVLDKVGELSDRERVDVLKSLLNIAYAKIQNRTTHSDVLKNAIGLLKRIVSMSQNSEVSQLNEVYLAAIDGLLSCVNHSGIRNVQQNILETYRDSINQVATIPYFTRQEKILSIRNKAYNNEFNTYVFQNIINEFETDVKERLKKLPEGNFDTLMGEMLGTIGQAYAFSSYGNSDYVDIAEGYLLNSLEFIPENHYFYAMSINFLSTLRWFSGDLDDAISLFSQHNEQYEGMTVTELIEVIVDTKTHLINDIFNLSVLLRIAISGDAISDKVIEVVEKYLWEFDINNHPYELIYKWLGIYHLKAGDHEKAMSAFNHSIKLASESGFTIKTIAVSVKGLRCLAITDPQLRGNEILKLKDYLSQLVSIEESFSSYIDSIGGWDAMLEDIENEDYLAITKWLPFSYA